MVLLTKLSSFDGPYHVYVCDASHLPHEKLTSATLIGLDDIFIKKDKGHHTRTLHKYESNLYT